MLSCFVLWSSGIDSTYLILKLLEKGYRVKAGYIEIVNNAKKTRMEKQAIQKMWPQIENRFNNFEFVGTIYKAHNTAPRGRGIKYKQVPYFMHGLLLAPTTDYRALGYVAGDSAVKNLENIRAVYNSYGLIYNGELPKLVFPLRTTNKATIISYMKDRYSGIFNNCVWCENPIGTEFVPCNECTPCVRRLNEMESLDKLSAVA